MRTSYLQALADDSDFSQPNNQSIVVYFCVHESRINPGDWIEENNCLLPVTRNE
jgi:hypothetical protein